MTQKQVLQDLLAKIEAGEAVVDDFVSAFQDGYAYPKNAHSAFMAYGGSLDAAKALHEAVVPDWAAQITTTGFVRMIHPTNPRLDQQARDGVLSRAYLIGQIKALIAEHKTP